MKCMGMVHTFSTEQIRGGNERNEEEPSKDGIGDSAGIRSSV